MHCCPCIDPPSPPQSQQTDGDSGRCARAICPWRFLGTRTQLRDVVGGASPDETCRVVQQAAPVPVVDVVIRQDDGGAWRQHCTGFAVAVSDGERQGSVCSAGCDHGWRWSAARLSEGRPPGRLTANVLAVVTSRLHILPATSHVAGGFSPVRYTSTGRSRGELCSSYYPLRRLVRVAGRV
jgi:hypothetical protein